MFNRKQRKEKRYCMPENDGWNEGLSRRVLSNTHIFNDSMFVKFDLSLSSYARGIARGIDFLEICSPHFFAKYWTSRYDFIPCELFLVEKDKQGSQACGELRLTSEEGLGGANHVAPGLQFRLFVTPEEIDCLKECFIEMSLKQGRPAPIRLLVEKPEGFEVKINHLGWTHSDPLPVRHYWTASYVDVERTFTPYDNQIDNFLSSYCTRQNFFCGPKDQFGRPQE